MEKTIEIITNFQPLILLLVGFLLPYLNNRLEKLINSKKYRAAKKAYDSIDPQIIKALGSRIKFLETIEEVVKATSDGNLTYGEVQSIALLTLRNFNLDKALGK